MKKLLSIIVITSTSLINTGYVPRSERNASHNLKHHSPQQAPHHSPHQNSSDEIIDYNALATSSNSALSLNESYNKFKQGINNALQEAAKEQVEVITETGRTGVRHVVRNATNKVINGIQYLGNGIMSWFGK